MLSTIPIALSMFVFAGYFRRYRVTLAKDNIEIRRWRYKMRLTGAILVAATTLSAVNPAQANDAPDIEKAIDQIFGNWNKPGVPGCAVGVEGNGVPQVIRGYGESDLEHTLPIGPTTVFEAGSVSKQFTAASILMLAEEGKLALTDDVHQYLPELPEYGTPITLNQLLAHTSGLRDWGQVEAMAGWPRGSRIYTLTDVLDIAARQKELNYRPGVAYSYTNTGYNLLAIIVERVSNQSLAQFSHDHLFVPLGMIHTQWRDDFQRVVPARAIAYEREKGRYRQDMPFENAYGNGGLLTTISDLLRWNKALVQGELGKFVTQELQRQNTLDNGHVIKYARGLFINSYRGAREVSHSGATAGYRAWLGRYPDSGLSIAVLCNVGEANTVALGHQIADLFLPELLSAKSNGVPLSSEQLTEHAGTYFNFNDGGRLVIEVQDDGLQISDGPMLVALSPSEFYSNNALFHFPDKDRLIMEAPDGQYEFQRVAAWHPDPVALQPLPGRYSSEEANATYQISMVDGRMFMAPVDRRVENLTIEPVKVDVFHVSNEGFSGILRVERDTSGHITGFDLGDSRVYSLHFKRINW